VHLRSRLQPEPLPSSVIVMAPMRVCSGGTAWLLVGLLGCGDDGSASGTTGGDSTTTTTTTDPSGGSGGSVGTDGETSGGEGSTGGEAGALGDLYGMPNVDDDDSDGQADWRQPPFAADDDLTSFSLPDWYVDALGEGDRVELTLGGEGEQIRLWRGDQVVLGDGEGGVQTSLVLTAAEAGKLNLEVEFGDFLRGASLEIRHMSGDEALRSDAIELWSAPMLVNHHLQNAEYVWAVKAGSNTSMTNTIASVVGDRFILVDSPDVWIQDELEWALATAPGKRLNIAMDSIRDRALDAYVKGLKAPDVQPMTWGNPADETTEDKFGNLEVTPPHSVGGVDYPLGRIYYGGGPSCGPNPEIKAHLDRQQVQAPIEVDTCWLCVGHVDEYISFIPAPGTDKGFKLLIADVDAAYAVLDAQPPGTALPRYSGSHGYGTIGEIVGDDALRALNHDLQADRIDPVREQLMAELDLDESDVLRMPALFERIWGCSYKDNGVAALIPGMLNLVVVNFEGEPLRIFVSDPFLRSDEGAQGSDPLIAKFTEMLPPEYEIHFVDDWYTYHVAIGEVHCGTNVARSPGAAWWTEARHLFTDR